MHFSVQLQQGNKKLNSLSGILRKRVIVKVGLKARLRLVSTHVICISKDNFVVDLKFGLTASLRKLMLSVVNGDMWLCNAMTTSTMTTRQNDYE